MKQKGVVAVVQRFVSGGRAGVSCSRGCETTLSINVNGGLAGGF